MKRLLLFGFCAALLAGAMVLGQSGKTKGNNDDAARAAAIKLFKSLTDEQKKLALKDVDDKDRYAEVFPPVERKGVPLKMLTADQKGLIDDVVRAMTSEYGASRCLEVAKQSGDDQRYLNFYGEPEEGKPFAWRLAQHHLTLIYAEFGKDKVNEFGPVLLGGNPVNKLWEDEEKILLELRAALSDEEAKIVIAKGDGTSGKAIGTAGMRIGDLGEKPRALAKKLLEQRLAVFSVERRKVLEDLIAADGGVEAQRLAIWGDTTKGHMDGGNYSWKIGGGVLLCDWQTAGKNHIHMTVRGKKA
jgi:hypothetical protein